MLFSKYLIKKKKIRHILKMMIVYLKKTSYWKERKYLLMKMLKKQTMTRDRHHPNFAKLNLYLKLLCFPFFPRKRESKFGKQSSSIITSAIKKKQADIFMYDLENYILCDSGLCPLMLENNDNLNHATVISLWLSVFIHCSACV